MKKEKHHSLPYRLTSWHRRKARHSHCSQKSLLRESWEIRKEISWDKASILLLFVFYMCKPGLHIHLSVCPFIHLPIHPIQPSVHAFICPVQSIHTSVHPLIPFIHPPNPANPSIHPPVYSYICPSHSSIHSFLCPSIHLSNHPSFVHPFNSKRYVESEKNSISLECKCYKLLTIIAVSGNVLVRNIIWTTLTVIQMFRNSNG